MNSKIRELLAQTANLPCDIATLTDDADLYDAGMSSFSSVQLMLAIEENYDIEIPEKMLTRRTFASIANIAEAIAEITEK
jgi:acyl carrier protein